MANDFFNNIPDHTSKFDPIDIAKNKTEAVLSYIGILILVPILKKESKFARFHANQGLILLITGIGVAIAFTILTAIASVIWWRLASFVQVILYIVDALLLVLAIMGIVNACNGKAKELPFIGKFIILK